MDVMAKINKRKRTVAGDRQKRTKRTMAPASKARAESNRPTEPAAVSKEAIPSGSAGKEAMKHDCSQPTIEVMDPNPPKEPTVGAEAIKETKPPGSSMRSPEKVSAPAAASTVEAGPAEKEEALELLAFQLADEEYAIDLLRIREIIRPVEITPVPRTVSFVKGIISLRGMIIPIFDLRTRLGLTEAPVASQTRILVVMLEKGLMGVIADRVNEVVKFKADEIEPPPSTVGEGLSGHLKGVCHINGRLLIILDLEKTVML